ncbi:unnamed protein product [Hapterophycus canaliculatus]
MARLTQFLSNDELNELIAAFPAVEFAFAYGSGVVKQQGYAEDVSRPSELPMLDLVLAVQDSEAWHKENLERNREHYSGLARLVGPGGVARLQENFGAKLYYNALVPISTTSHRGRSMKYGVISMKHLTEDLEDWTWLYTAGRLHKPVRVIRGSKQASNIIQGNLVSATKASLLLLPERFSAQDLYTTVAGLSYTGDFRMHFGENPDKVKNIVSATQEKFQDLYAPALKGIPGLAATGHDCSVYAQDVSPNARLALARSLPRAVRGRLPLTEGGFSSSGLAGGGASLSVEVSRALASVVSRSSLRQGVKGLLTAGVLKSAAYSVAKVTQAAAGRRKRRQDLPPRE